MNDPRTVSELHIGSDQDDSPLLRAFGERLRTLRARRGFARRTLAQTAEVSDRYLAELEYGRANPSLLILHQISRALQCSLAELLGDVTASSPEWLLIRELLESCSEDDLRKLRVSIGELRGTGGDRRARSRRIALIGLRGAGKSSLGRMLAADFNMPFVELSAEIERLAGYSIGEIHNLYGPQAYRRYERRALEEVLQIYTTELVLATPGGLVSEPATFNELLSHCVTVWLKAAPEDHMARVAAQGDTRPMAASVEAMEDLRRILQGRAAFYSKADWTLDTSAQSLQETFEFLRVAMRKKLEEPRPDRA